MEEATVHSAGGAILEIVREVLGRPLGLDDDMFDHGATSLAFVRVLARINDEFGVMVDVADLDGVTSARSLAPHVLSPASRPVTETIGA